LPRGSAVLAAHPDDEVVGAAVLLSRSPGCHVVYTTDGVPRDTRLWPRSFSSADDYARLRRAEAEAALALVGIERRSIHRLGGVDQESVREAARLARDLTELLAGLRPPVLVLQPYEGGHPDHDAAALVGRAAAALVARRGIEPPALWEMSSYHAGDATVAVGCFLPPRAAEAKLAPSAEERALKARMLALHGSQAQTLAAFGRAPEVFRRAPPADFSRPPHPGELHFERMGWMHGADFRSLAAAALGELGLPLLLESGGGPTPPPASSERG
jgi:N-acetylglucosamine malate deacetylase 2